MPSPNVKMVVGVLEVEEVTFTLVTNKKYKEKSKASFFKKNFLFNNLLYVAQLQSIANYLQYVAYSFKSLRGHKPPL